MDGLSRPSGPGAGRGAAETTPPTAGGARSTRSARCGRPGRLPGPGFPRAGPAGVWSPSLRAPVWVDQAASGRPHRPFFYLRMRGSGGEPAEGGLGAETTRSPVHASGRPPTLEDPQFPAASALRPSGEASGTEPGPGPGGAPPEAGILPALASPLQPTVQLSGLNPEPRGWRSQKAGRLQVREVSEKKPKGSCGGSFAK
uniref:cuticle collagen 8-like n=1 Tax=Macaca mulatta TaxID=9544 RepID=UPI0010A25AFA|nr:cuticle collagen 8-like [Macaca mulatta]